MNKRTHNSDKKAEKASSAIASEEKGTRATRNWSSEAPRIRKIGKSAWNEQTKSGQAVGIIVSLPKKTGTMFEFKLADNEAVLKLPTSLLDGLKTQDVQVGTVLSFAYKKIGTALAFSSPTLLATNSQEQKNRLRKDITTRQGEVPKYFDSKGFPEVKYTVERISDLPTPEGEADDLSKNKKHYRRASERPHPELAANAEPNRTKKQVKLRLPQDLIDDVSNAAEDDGLDRNSWIEEKLRQALKPN